MEHRAVVIVGAGLGGLTAARVLSLHGVPVTVYDSGDPGPAGMLDVHPDTGQAALRACGLHERFRALVRPGGDTLRILDRDATVHHEEQHRDRPEVQRRDLRDLLIASLPDGVVRWGVTVSDVQPLGGGRHELTVTGGAPVTTDVLVGADGPWSRVRPLVSDAVPTYTGLSYVDVCLEHAGTRHPEAAAALGGGLMVALGDGKGLIGHRDADGSLHVYAVARTAAPGVMPAGAFAGWHPSLRAMVPGGTPVARPIHALPVGHRWPRVPGVTLLGDAAHVMPPFAGEGANLAMLDGAELAAAIVGRPGDTEAALTAYEELLFGRSEVAAAESAAHLAVCFRPDAPRGLVDLLTSYRELITVGE